MKKSKQTKIQNHPVNSYSPLFFDVCCICWWFVIFVDFYLFYNEWESGVGVCLPFSISNTQSSIWFEQATLSTIPRIIAITVVD